MIQDFFQTVQQDFTRITSAIGDGINGKKPLNQDQQQKVALAAIRMFAILGMAYSAVMGFRVFSADSSPVGKAFRLAVAASLYALSHDIFIIARNAEQSLVTKVAAVGKGIFEDMKDLWNGAKDFDDAPRHYLNEGTFFRPIWDMVAANSED